MKRNHIKIVGSSALVMCMTLVMLLWAFRTEASETKEVKYVEGISYTKDNTIPEITDEDLKSELDGYLFAGWYTKSDEGETYNPVSNPTLNGTYYAKYVPEEVLDIKAQISGTLLNADTTDDTKSSIRFVTSIDSTDYKQISFNIKRPNKEYDAETTKYVYRELYAVDATAASESTLLKTYKPSEFHATSQFFKTWTISNVPDTAYDTDITVTPYWVTLDGTRVEGTKSIKSVNLGRSWIYIDTTANADTEQYGTKDHPFTALDVALNTVKRENGKIIVKGTSTFEVPSTFKWNQDKTKVNGKVRTITVTGENGTSSFISFDTVPDMHFNDNVTFDNVKLHFATQVYANGNQFTIADSVVLNNTDTNLYGGASKTSVESTYLEVHAGTWTGIYGGGRYTGGDVSNDTNIHITKAKVFSDTENSSMIVGGGRGSNTVGGNTNVTVGEGFNSGVTIEDGHYSAIYGGGKDSGSVVEGDTNVIVKDGAKVNFVYGGGASNTSVNGTCNVTLENGEVYSIWGGARGEGTDAGKNMNDTVVKVTGGTVAQIIGGNGTGMTGNTYVEVTGGTVTRRIYGGCYHSSADGAGYVDGTTAVVIGKGVTLDWSMESIIEKICAGSRFAGEQDEEVGILIFNGGTYNSNHVQGNSADVYDYLVKATEGGKITVANDVVADATMLRVTPDDAATPGTMTSGNTVTYFKGEGVCALPTADTMDVDFSPLDAQAGLESCEARIDGIYYPQFQNAVGIAKVRQDKPTVTLLKDATVDTTLDIVEGAEFTILSEGTPKTITSTLTGDNEILFDMYGKLTLENLNITGGHHTFRNHAGSDVRAENVSITNIEGAAIFQSNGTFTGIDLNIDTVVKHGIFIEGGTVNLDNVTISNIVGDASSRDGIHCAGGTLNITANNEQKNGVTISNVHSRGIFLQGKIKADQVKINDANLYGIYVDGSAQPEISNLTIDGVIGVDNVTDAEGTGIVLEDNSQSKLTTVNIKNTKNKGIYIRDNAQATISNATVQDAIKQGVFLENDAQATITGLTVSNTSNQGVFLQHSAQATISDFTISGKGDTALRCKNGSSVTATNGTIYAGTATSGSLYGIYIDSDETGASNVSLTNVKIERASSNDHALVVIKSGATLTMNEQDGGTSSIDGKKGTYTGRGVEVEGTFNLNGGTIYNNELSSGDGAGVLVSAGGTLNMTGGSISNNVATAGGGVAVKNGSTFNLDNEGSISNNYATSDGAGVYLCEGATLTMNGGTIESNELGAGDARGGGISMYASGTNKAIFNLNGGEIKDNIGRAGGAVILRSSNCEFTMNGGTIITNHANTINSKNGQGGAVYVIGGVFNMTDGTICKNDTTTQGGGIYVNSGTCNLTGGTIGENTATTNGGAVFVGGGTCDIKGVTISENTATTAGGGVFVNNGTCTIEAGSITGNFANVTTNNHGGGGICVNGGTCVVKGTVIISKNTAKQGGGGVSVQGGTFKLQGGTITANIAATGGGISVNGSEAIVEISGGTISNHNNSKLTHGAGVIVRSCKEISMTGGIITGNTAITAGGGIYLKPCTFTITGGEITNNTSKSGGAIYVDKGSSTTPAATISFGGGVISGNSATAGTNQAGIYCNGTTDDTKGTMVYTNDKTKADIADGVTNMK